VSNVKIPQHLFHIFANVVFPVPCNLLFVLPSSVLEPKEQTMVFFSKKMLSVATAVVLTNVAEAVRMVRWYGDNNAGTMVDQHAATHAMHCNFLCRQFGRSGNPHSIIEPGALNSEQDFHAEALRRWNLMPTSVPAGAEEVPFDPLGAREIGCEDPETEFRWYAPENRMVCFSEFDRLMYRLLTRNYEYTLMSDFRVDRNQRWLAMPKAAPTAPAAAPAAPADAPWAVPAIPASPADQAAQFQIGDMVMLHHLSPYFNGLAGFVEDMGLYRGPQGPMIYIVQLEGGRVSTPRNNIVLVRREGAVEALPLQLQHHYFRGEDDASTTFGETASEASYDIATDEE